MMENWGRSKIDDPDYREAQEWTTATWRRRLEQVHLALKERKEWREANVS